MTDISIVMSAYNGQDYVEEAIISALSQKDVDLEFILIDDCSTDHTKEIISKYVDSRSNWFDPRIKYFEHTQNKGIIPSYLEGISLTSSNCFKILDQDDVLSDSSVLKRQKEAMDSEPNMAFVSGKAIYIDEKSNPYREYSYPHPAVPLDKKKAKRVLASQGRGFF
jgi:glycosyltransferase involved in cell wall biosynthesis